MSASESCVDDCESAFQRPQDCHFEFATPVLRRRRSCGFLLLTLTNADAESFELFFYQEEKRLRRHRRLRGWGMRKRSWQINLRFTSASTFHAARKSQIVKQQKSGSLPDFHLMLQPMLAT